MRFGLSFPRIYGFRPWVSVSSQELSRAFGDAHRPARRARLPSQTRRELRAALEAAAKTRNEEMSRAYADELIDRAMTGEPGAVQKLLEHCISVKFSYTVERKEAEAAAPEEVTSTWNELGSPGTIPPRLGSCVKV
jgi:hypothetical protein